jgi:hypothetical protein
VRGCVGVCAEVWLEVDCHIEVPGAKVRPSFWVNGLVVINELKDPAEAWAGVCARVCWVAVDVLADADCQREVPEGKVVVSLVVNGLAVMIELRVCAVGVLLVDGCQRAVPVAKVVVSFKMYGLAVTREVLLEVEG